MARKLRRADGGPLSLCTCTLLLPLAARGKLFVALLENAVRPRFKARPRSRAGCQLWHALGHRPAHLRLPRMRSPCTAVCLAFQVACLMD